MLSVLRGRRAGGRAVRQGDILASVRALGRPCTVPEIVRQAGAPYNETTRGDVGTALRSMAKYGLVRQAGAVCDPSDHRIRTLWEAVE